jgi:hypothetical protein
VPSDLEALELLSMNSWAISPIMRLILSPSV